MLGRIMSSVASTLRQSIMDARATVSKTTGPVSPSVKEKANNVIPSPNIGTDSKKQGKKRAIEELSPPSPTQSTAGSLEHANVARSRANEPASKRARATLNNVKYSPGIKLMNRIYLYRHAAMLRKHGQLPTAYANRQKLADQFGNIIFKLMICEATSDLFADRMEQLKSMAHEIQDLEERKDKKDSRVEALIRCASNERDSLALAFLDGPCLFHVFSSLQSDLRARLYELDLPLAEIKQLKLDLKHKVPGTLEQYYTTRAEAEVRAEEILECLDASYYDQQLQVLSDHDARHRNTHDRCQDNLVTVIENSHAALVHTNDQLTSILEKVMRAHIQPQHTPQQIKAPLVPSTLQSKALESPPQSQEIAVVTAQETAHEKSLETSAHQRQREDARHKKFLVDFLAYGTLIQELKNYRDGGPHPNREYMKELGMHDMNSCVHRLKYLWTKHSSAVQAHDVELLRTDTNVYMETAICFREAHCIMHMLLYHKSKWWDVAEAGWNLAEMRDLQAEMVQWAHEDPLMYTKLDVDAVCQALQDVHDQHALAQNQASMSQPKTHAGAKKRDHPPRVYRQVPLVEQGCVSTTTITLPGLNGVAFEQVTDKVVGPAPPLPTILECDRIEGDDDEMEVDQQENICRQFLHGKGCTLVDDVDDPCPYNHPYPLKANGPCPFLLQGIDCPFGPTGCQYVHNHIVLPMEQQNDTQIYAPQTSGALKTVSVDANGQELIANGTGQPVEPEYYVSAPNGDAVDPRISDNYCNNFAKNRCKNQQCRRIHAADPYQQNSAPANAQSVAPRGGVRLTQPTKPCLFFMKGRCGRGNTCSYSHDPQVIQQASRHNPTQGNVQTGNRAPSNTHGPQQRKVRACRNEANGGHCKYSNCTFAHTNLQSKTYSQPPHHQGNVPHGQDQLWDQSRGIQFAPPDTQQVHNWRAGVAQAQHPAQKDERICHACKQPGHVRNNCPMNNNRTGGSTNTTAATNNYSGAGNNAATKVCHNCGLSGHMKRECPQNRGNVGRGNYDEGVDQGSNGSAGL